MIFYFHICAQLLFLLKRKKQNTLAGNWFCILDMENQLRYLFLCLFLLNREIASTKASYYCKNSCRWCTKSSLEKLEKSILENKSISRFFDDYIFLSADKLMSRFSGKRLIGWIGLIVNAHIRNRVDCSIFISKWFFYRNNGMKLFLK